MLFIKPTCKYYPNDYIYKVYKDKRHDYKFIGSPLSLFHKTYQDVFIYKKHDDERKY